jgi:hypothetical protein
MPDLRVIPAAELLELSPRHPVTLQDGTMDVFEGIPFATDEAAVAFRATQQSETMGKLDIPLALPMHGEFRDPPADRPSIWEKLGIDPPVLSSGDGEPALDGTGSDNRSNEDFRIVLPDREVTPTDNERCQVMPYMLFNGVTSILLRVELVEEGDNELFMHDSFHLNIYDKGASHPVNGVSDATLQVILLPSDPSDADRVIERYEALKEEAGQIIEGIINPPVAAESPQQ